MFGAAAFSHSSWAPGEAADQFEDSLHSVFASCMGLAFCVGVVAQFVHRGPRAYVGRCLDTLALVVALLLPLLMASAFSIGGLVQRVMFAVAYVWFGREALIALSFVNEQNAAEPFAPVDEPRPLEAPRGNGPHRCKFVPSCVARGL
jgi:hypothetical protein